jgi:polyisoprenoid-binding protein YceI
MLSILAILAAQTFAFAPNSRLWIEGDSNLHPWSCEATRPDAKIEVDTSSPGLARSLTLQVHVDGLDCGSGKMNEKLRDALKLEQFPEIDYRLTSAERVPGQELLIKATGDLTLAGKTRPVTFTVEVKLAADGTAQARGKVDILMSDFGVDPPTALLILKTYDKVTVHFEIRTTPVSSAHAALP